MGDSRLQPSPERAAGAGLPPPASSIFNRFGRALIETGCRYDKGLYCRIITLNLAMLAGVHKTHPLVSAHLESGHGLSFRRSTCAFTSVADDLLCEHWNKVCKSPRGITYCATNQRIRGAWFQSLPERGRTWDRLRKWVPKPMPKRVQRRC